MTSTVIIPTTGSPEVFQAIESVLAQTAPTQCYVVLDGKDNFTSFATKVIEKKLDTNPNVKFCTLPVNVGADGFYGHRVYAAFTHLINTKYVLYLDQDNWFDGDHVQRCLEKIEGSNLDWVYSLRKIISKDGEYICNDDCESLGKWKCYQNYNHVDTNSYCIKTDIAVRLASVWHGKWGQDRVFYETLSTHFVNYECTGEYTCNYRLAGNLGSVSAEFFKAGNDIMNRRYGGNLPWVN
jgi:hypothetical protein